MYASKVEAYMSKANGWLGWKSLPLTNTPAYWADSLVTKKIKYCQSRSQELTQVELLMGLQVPAIIGLAYKRLRVANTKAYNYYN